MQLIRHVKLLLVVLALIVWYCYRYQYSCTGPVPVLATKSVASICGLRLVVWPKIGTNPARVAFGGVWSYYQNYGTRVRVLFIKKNKKYNEAQSSCLRTITAMQLYNNKTVQQ